MIDVLVVGAGPAGMSAALQMRSYGLAVTVIDDQPSPGGRIYTAIESRKAHGREEQTGASLVARFRASGGAYLSETEVWQIESGPRVFLTCGGRATVLEPRFVLLASGAQERPMPFPGWQLPGVMTVGAAQILLKSARQIPGEPVWLAGTGPLLRLYVHQLLAAGGHVAGILDTTPRGRTSASAGLLLGAIPYGWRDLFRGLSWSIDARHVRVVRNVTAINAIGSDSLSGVRYNTALGRGGEVKTNLLLVHDGVVPAVHNTLAAGCEHRWNAPQRCFEPILDRFNRSSNPAIFVAGDGATIGGGRAAAVSGKIAAIGVGLAAGKITQEVGEAASAPLRRELAAAARFRQFLDALFPPTEMPLPDATLVCRCEEVTAQQLRGALEGRNHLGPDGAKIATRAGMGPCQGRLCGLSLTKLIAEAHGGSPEEVGFLRIRPPLKPLTIGELAGLEIV